MALAAAANKVEFAVIDAKLIEGCLLKARAEAAEEKRSDEWGAVRDFDEPIQPHMATELALSFCSLKSIDNLMIMKNLKKLCLDNNAIAEIKNLDHLVHLEWLDLSFNNIEAIQGLSKLTKLTDLVLFNNNISVLENLDTLPELEVLSLGNNKIKVLESLMYLRQFRKLKVVNLDGNPVCDESDYKSTMYAYMPWLEYLDYAFIDDAKRKEARDLHQHLLLDLEEEERSEAVNKAHEEETKARADKLREAGLLDIDELKTSVWADDPAGDKLQMLPGVEQLAGVFRETLQQLIDETLEKGATYAKLLATEVAEMQSALAETRKATQTAAIGLITDFTTLKKHELREATKVEDEPEKVLAAVQTVRAALEKLNEELFARELALNEQCTEMITDFEINYVSMAAKRRDVFAALFRELETAANGYKDAVLAKVTVLLDQVKDGGTLEGLDEDTAALVADKEVVLALIQTSNDAQVGKLLGCEDIVRTSEAKRQAAAIDGERKKELQRNRAAVVEITHAVKGFTKELDVLEAESKALKEELRAYEN